MRVFTGGRIMLQTKVDDASPDLSTKNSIALAKNGILASFRINENLISCRITPLPNQGVNAAIPRSDQLNLWFDSVEAGPTAESTN